MSKESEKESANFMAKIVEKLDSPMLLYALGSTALLIGAASAGEGILKTLQIPFMVIIGLGFGCHLLQEYMKAKRGSGSGQRGAADGAAVRPVSGQAMPVATLRRSWPSAISFALLVIVVLGLEGEEGENTPDVVAGALIFLLTSLVFGMWGIVSTWGRWDQYKWEWMGWTSVAAAVLLIIGIISE